MKYQREFEIKKDVVTVWRGRVEDHRELVK